LEATLVGLFLHDILPKDHLSDDSKDTVKLGMGMVATLAALILGLLIGFATKSFNNMRSEVQQTAANIILLDRAMANCGAETKEIRDLLRLATRARIESIWSEGDFEPSRFESADAVAASEVIQGKIRELSPRTDAQRWLQSRALSLSNESAQTRWLLITQAGSSIPPVLLAVLVFWLAIIFLSFGLFASQRDGPRRLAGLRAVGFRVDLSPARTEQPVRWRDQDFQCAHARCADPSWPVARNRRAAHGQGPCIYPRQSKWRCV
jgi:hypothetical protein